jgi:hypothetical protein
LHIYLLAEEDFDNFGEKEKLKSLSLFEDYQFNKINYCKFEKSSSL